MKQREIVTGLIGTYDDDVIVSLFDIKASDIHGHPSLHGGLFFEPRFLHHTLFLTQWDSFCVYLFDFRLKTQRVVTQ